MPSIDITTLKRAIHTWIVAGSGLAADRVRWGFNAPQPTRTPTVNGVVTQTDAWIALRLSSVRGAGSDWNQYKSEPFTFGPIVVTLDAGTDLLTAEGHDFNTGDGPVQLETEGTLSGTNLLPMTDYWVVRIDDDTFKLATSFQHAMATVPVTVDIMSIGAGAHTVISVDTTVRRGQELREYVRGGRVLQVTVTCFPPQPSTDSTEAVAILADVVTEAGKSAQADALSEAHLGLFSAGEPQGIDGVMNAVYFEPRATMTVVFSTKAEISSLVGSLEDVEVENEDTGTTFPVEGPPGGGFSSGFDDEGFE